MPDQQTIDPAQEISTRIAEIDRHMQAIKTLSHELHRWPQGVPKLREHLYGPYIQGNQRLWQNCRCFQGRLNMLPTLPKGGVVCEVGTLKGGWARKILDITKPSKLYTIDTSYSQFEHAHFTDDIASGRLELLQGTSWVRLAEFPDEHFDWIYIDADHTYNAVRRDAEVALRKIKRDGYLVFNDFTTVSVIELMPYGIARAAIELATKHDLEFTHFAFEYLGYHDIALRRRKG
jgi:predicted O-methyltransferase YrrM